MHVPSYEFILNQLGYKRGEIDDNSTVQVPLRFLKMLLQISSAAEQFDESLYVNNFNDVASAIKAGTFVSGAQHYLAVGYFEGRRNPNVPLDESWYIENYEGVFSQISSYGLSSVMDHYLTIGMKNGYAPNAKAHEELRFWMEMLEPADSSK